MTAPVADAGREIERQNTMATATFTPRQGEKTIRERVAWLEGQMHHLATKAWVLGGVLGGMAVAASIATSIALVVAKMMLAGG